MTIDQRKLAEELRKQVQRMVADESVLEQEWENFDFQQAFKRLLEQDDWTDKVIRGIGKIRGATRRPQKSTGPRERVHGAAHRPGKDTELSEDLKTLIPDMKQVAAAYAEMTEGYKEFIRTVLEAKNQTRKG